nr:putative N-acetylated-alpha-linked acidic dipeptidase [Cherax quadricarinatus]
MIAPRSLFRIHFFLSVFHSSVNIFTVGLFCPQSTIGEPQYHTLYETFALASEIYDKGFHYHTAVAAMWGDLAVVLSESKVLPFSLVKYSNFISKAQDDIIERFGPLINSQNISLEHFTNAGKAINESVTNFNKALEYLDLKRLVVVIKKYIFTYLQTL